MTSTSRSTALTRAERTAWQALLNGTLDELGWPCRNPGCQHPKTIHQHNRSHTDCGQADCWCTAYRGPGVKVLAAKVRRLLRRVPS